MKPSYALLALLVACGSSSNPGDDGSASMPAIDAALPDGGTTVTYTCASTLHVSTTGDDSSDGSDAAPIATLRAAAMRATAGTCIRVRAGTYDEPETIVFSADGTAGAPIVLVATDGPLSVVLDASENNAGQAMFITRDHIVVDGISFEGMPTDTQQTVVHIAGANTGKGRGVTLRNNAFTGGWDMLKINERAGDAARGAGNRIRIEGNDFRGTPGHLLVSVTGGYAVELVGNRFHDAWEAASPSDAGAIQVKGGSAYAVFERNRFERIHTLGGAIAFGDGCSGSCDIDPDHYAVVESYAANNVFVEVGRAFDFAGARACSAFNNTIVSSATQTVAFKLYPATTGSTERQSLNVRIENNLVANPDGDLFGIVQINGTSGTGLVMGHNLYFDGGDPVSHGETGSVVADPAFVSSSERYAVSSGSPARLAGTNLSAFFTGDHEGAARPANGAWTIGAYE